ncbi:MAG: DNA recombination protein RmuC [Tenericutes bacterium HGW-Tenericutes-6]|jgi:DNA recombination protein RmuC|nr:MAG: DNA recombination protein RmuC [Tenericutes bacterium HGW-Tenericutes-6]
MDYVLLGLIGFLIIFQVTSFLYLNKKQKEPIDLSDQKEIQNELKIYLSKEYGDLKLELNKLLNESQKAGQQDLNTFRDSMMVHIERQLKAINDRVDERLGKGFEDTKVTFTNVMERLGRIDEAQKKIESLSNEVVSLNVLLTDKKSRGIYGEVQLYQLLSAVLGDNKELYDKQKTLSNSFIADAIVYAPEPVGSIAIDSKFPLDNYKRMVNKDLGELDRKQAEKDFKNDMKKHINDIKNKYIIPGETSDQAIMFVPAEAIFSEVHANHEDIVQYANLNKIWIVSPTTLIATLSMIQMVVKNMERDKQTGKIVQELRSLSEEFTRYIDRWDKLKRSIDSVSRSAEQVHITSTKINTKFKHISEAKFDLLDVEDEIDDIEDEETDI